MTLVVTSDFGEASGRAIVGHGRLDLKGEGIDCGITIGSRNLLDGIDASVETGKRNDTIAVRRKNDLGGAQFAPTIDIFFFFVFCFFIFS